MREIVTINTEVEISDIRPLIWELRGQAVMLDRDLASLYHVMTGRLNEAVKRNIARFPAEFMFQLSDSEMKELIANCDRFRMMKHSPSRMYAFTEQGVAMLSTVASSRSRISRRLPSNVASSPRRSAASATTALSSLTARKCSGLVPRSRTLAVLPSRGCLCTLRVRLSPNLPSEMLRISAAHLGKNGRRNHLRTSRLNPQGDIGTPRIRQKQAA